LLGLGAGLLLIPGWHALKEAMRSSLGVSDQLMINVVWVVGFAVFFVGLWALRAARARGSERAETTD
jgi:hypothetical protein